MGSRSWSRARPHDRDFACPRHPQPGRPVGEVPVAHQGAGSFGALELIVVGNGSSDSTPEVLEKLARFASFPVQVLSEITPGLGRAHKLCDASDSPALLNFGWMMYRRARGLARAHGLELQPIGPPVAIVAGDAWPCKAWPSGHRLRQQGLDKGQRPGTRSTVRSTAKRGWIAHFHPFVFLKRLKSRLFADLCG
jgi:glycosyltransferase involved in cell wall biosynthesis